MIDKYFFPNGQNFDDFSGFKDTSPISETEKSQTIELSIFFSPLSNVLFIACCVLQISAIIEEYVYCKVIHNSIHNKT